MTTVGYGDETVGTNPYEVFISLLILIGGGMYYSYLIGILAKICGDIQQSNDKIMNYIHMIDFLMQKHNLPFEIGYQMKKYYTQYVKDMYRTDGIYEIDDIIPIFPTEMQNEVLKYMY